MHILVSTYLARLVSTDITDCGIKCQEEKKLLCGENSVLSAGSVLTSAQAVWAWEVSHGWGMDKGHEFYNSIQTLT